jgi:hypothetical protein
MRYELTIDFGPEDPDNTALAQSNTADALYGAVIAELRHRGYFSFLGALTTEPDVTDREVPS